MLRTNPKQAGEKRAVTMNKPPPRALVSIGLPVYNGARFLDEAVVSLLAQDYSPLELVISDNASTDATESLCRAWAVKDSRVRYMRHAATINGEENFNAALAAARGEFFMWAADDDLWEPTFISTLTQLLQGDPGAELAFCDFNAFERKTTEGRRYSLCNLSSGSRLIRLRRFLRQNESDGKANLIYALMRRETIAAIGGFKIWGRGLWGIDMLVVLRLLAEGNLALSPDLLFHKRIAPPRTGVSGPVVSHSPVSEARGKLHNKLGYFAGCANILRDINLTARERLLLRLELARLRAYAGLREGGQAMAGAAKKRRRRKAVTPAGV
ncbi:MAG: glycosyltransferase family 2 protein [Verrucomicrobia bacterium]|nr:glycosyltransferase family 2 protein [Verrucomicrobiota bacterium]